MSSAGSLSKNKPAGLGVTHGLHHQDPPALSISFEADYPNPIKVRAKALFATNGLNLD